MDNKEIALALTQIIYGGNFQYSYDAVIETFNNIYEHLNSLSEKPDA